jgi:hypothetical protein
MPQERRGPVLCLLLGCPTSVAERGQYLFPSRFRKQPRLSTRQYARIVHRWVERAGLDSSAYGTHSMRRTKPAQIYKKMGNLRAVELLGHTKLRAPSATSASRSTMLSASPRRLSSESATRPLPRVGPRPALTVAGVAHTCRSPNAGPAQLGGQRPLGSSQRPTSLALSNGHSGDTHRSGASSAAEKFMQ